MEDVNNHGGDGARRLFRYSPLPVVSLQNPLQWILRAMWWVLLVLSRCEKQVCCNDSLVVVHYYDTSI
jgi:hypothetical protein